MSEAPRPRFDRKTLQTLGAFLPRFEAPGFEFARFDNRPGVFPGFILSSVACDFVSACYEAGWVQGGFDWSRWSRSPEARRLYSDPAALKTATPEQLSRLLTLLIRQNRFVDGTLDAAFDSGLLVRTLRRIAVLAPDAPEPPRDPDSPLQAAGGSG